MSASAMDIAVGLLAHRDYSTHQIKTKLQQKGFESNEIESTLQLCLERGFLDDVRFAALLVRSHISKGHGKNRIRQSLYQKGLDKACGETALNSSDCDWYELAKTKANKKFANSGEISDQKERAKRVRYLLAQGFDYDQISYALAIEPD
ncbi:recombination regulator RecX [Shewanella sp. AS1]|uniref:recombination regulator RecX n=1 Tax=Shewanella sp. AS1 TaxID=2907626 RepID=UPI001F2FC6AE|nr:recombination regulator RecX [Shewanella sp. AS1]MCE9679147.1 recombination regulator RecX [Shewanella sp. AS1]